MADLHLTGVPDEYMRCIREIATAKQWTVEEAALWFLKEGVNFKYPPTQVPRSEMPALLEEARRIRATMPPGSPDSVELLREDRDR
jgi:hypothetical protein